MRRNLFSKLLCVLLAGVLAAGSISIPVYALENDIDVSNIDTNVSEETINDSVENELVSDIQFEDQETQFENQETQLEEALWETIQLQ